MNNEFGTFGSLDRIKCLVYIEEKFMDLGKNQRKYITRLITEANHYCKELNNVRDVLLRRKSAQMLLEDFNTRLDNMHNRPDDEKFVSHMKNFFNAKFKPIIKSK